MKTQVINNKVLKLEVNPSKYFNPRTDQYILSVDGVPTWAYGNLHTDCIKVLDGSIELKDMSGVGSLIK